MSLADDIAAWDSKESTHISRVYAVCYQHPEFIASLISLTASEPHQDGATWLFKHAIDEGDLIPEAIEPDLIVEFCASLKDLTRWPAQLHALQILCIAPIPDSAAKHAEVFARECMNSDTKFVRAWSYSALLAATKHDPKRHAKTMRLLQNTLEDDNTPASVKARIRNALKS